jgi:hypothetical protein
MRLLAGSVPFRGGGFAPRGVPLAGVATLVEPVALWQLGDSLGLIPTLFLPPPAKIALVSLFIIWFGIGEGSKIATLAFGVFFPTAITTAGGVDNVLSLLGPGVTWVIGLLECSYSPGGDSMGTAGSSCCASRRSAEMAGSTRRRPGRSSQWNGSICVRTR